MKRTQQRFTLVELLVVIGIIAVLAGILLPTISVAIKRVRVARATTEISSLITAIRMYESEYDLMPIAYSTTQSKELSTAEYTQLIAILSQTDVSGNTYAATGNARKQRMLDVKKAGEYKDPWEKDYHVVVDPNANDVIDSANVVGMATGQSLSYNLIIWSAGPDEATSSTPSNSNNKDNVYSIDTNWDPNSGHVLR